MTKASKEIVVREQGTTVPFQCPGLTETNYTTWSIMIETVLRAYGHWDAITEDEVDEKKNNTTKGIIFQTLPENVLLQVAKYKNAKYVWESIKVQYIEAERVQKARLQTLRNELEMLKMNDNESINDFAGKISGIVAKFKSLGSSLEKEVIVRKFLNSVPKKYLPIVAPIEQYSDLETMPFEEAVGKVKAYEERLQSLEAKDEDQGQLMKASEQKHGENSGRGRGRGRNS
uniref:Zinc finger, CCHC-type n=1 Tax=Tanacetum cinerariifolium TaxID=118510 RepID=A0A699I0V2_TANCI|nr:zinc finger, CCHC-type [Tanacetum cinerariifolium]